MINKLTSNDCLTIIESFFNINELKNIIQIESLNVNIPRVLNKGLRKDDLCRLYIQFLKERQLNSCEVDNFRSEMKSTNKNELIEDIIEKEYSLGENDFDNLNSSAPSLNSSADESENLDEIVSKKIMKTETELIFTDDKSFNEFIPKKTEEIIYKDNLICEIYTKTELNEIKYTEDEMNIRNLKKIILDPDIMKNSSYERKQVLIKILQYKDDTIKKINNKIKYFNLMRKIFNMTKCNKKRNQPTLKNITDKKSNISKY